VRQAPDKESDRTAIREAHRPFVCRKEEPQNLMEMQVRLR
jgi:hypothetical protein